MHEKTNKATVHEESADSQVFTHPGNPKKSPKHLTETSCFLSVCFLGTLSFDFSWHSKKFQEKEVTLLLTGLWLDDENAPQGNRKLGLESPFWPLGLRHDVTSLSTATSKPLLGLALTERPTVHTSTGMRKKTKPRSPGLLVLHWYLQWTIFSFSIDVKACRKKVAARKALILYQHLQHTFQDRWNPNYLFS